MYRVRVPDMSMPAGPVSISRFPDGYGRLARNTAIAAGRTGRQDRGSLLYLDNFRLHACKFRVHEHGLEMNGQTNRFQETREQDEKYPAGQEIVFTCLLHGQEDRWRAPGM